MARGEATGLGKLAAGYGSPAGLARPRGRRLRWGVVVSGGPVCLQAFQMSLFGLGVGSLFLPVEPLRKTEQSWRKLRSWQAAQERARRVGLCATSHCQDLLSTSLVCLMARIAVISGCSAAFVSWSNGTA